MAQTTFRHPRAQLTVAQISGDAKAWRALGWRRLLAWSLELGLFVGSAAIPWGAGEWVRRHADPSSAVPLNRIVSIVQEETVRLLKQPKTALIEAVPPLTNVFWLSAIGFPVVVSVTQMSWLATRGKTLPKHWLGLQVTTLDGLPPGWLSILKREVVCRWGGPTLLAYSLWLLSGAFPSLVILPGLVVICLLGEGLTAQLTRSQRALHDAVARTQVILPGDVYVPIKYRPESSPAQTASPQPSSDLTVRSLIPPGTSALVVAEETGGLISFVLAPDVPPHGWQSRWLRPYFLLGLGALGLSGVAIVLGLTGTGIYVEQQTTYRSTRQQNDEVFLSLVDTLTLEAQSAEEKQSAALALASTQDSRVVPLLVDLFAQTREPQLLEALQQALITLGPDTLPYLRRLNQTLSKDIAALPPEQRSPHLLRQQAVKRTIAKILTVYGGHLKGMDLSNTQLGQVVNAPDAFVLPLEHSDLAGISFRGSVLAGAQLQHSHFFDAGPDKRPDTYDDWISDLSGADLTEADLSQAKLQRSRFQGSSLLRAVLNGSEAMQADFSGANLSSARLIEADLSQADLDGASLVGADLTAAQLPEASLVAIRLQQSKAMGADLTAANLKNAELMEADLSDANLQKANLRGANLRGANLQHTNLAQANLAGADLSQTNLEGAVLTGAQLAQADFSGARFTLPHPQNDNSFIDRVPTEREGQSLRGVDFSKALNLNREQLTHICAQGGIHPACLPRATKPQESQP